MRVLHFYKTYKPDSMGGAEELIGQICSGAAKHGITSEVLTVSKDTTSVDFGDHVHHRAKLDVEIASSAFSMAAFGRFRELAENADLIHYHFPWPFADVVHFATRVKKPTVVTYHSDIVRQKVLLQFYKPLRDRFLASVDAIVATSPNYLATSDVLRRYREKVTVIPIGLDEKTYRVPTEEKRQYWSARIGPKFFLFVGNLRYYKGLHVLLDAMQGTEFKAVIVGAGPAERNLRAQAERLGLTNVEFVGPVGDDDKVALLSLCYALTFPSHLRSEAFGISLLEGAMFGKPMLSTEIGTGTSYVNLDDVTGYVVPGSDSAALRVAMGKLWANQEAAARFGVAARARFEAMFTADKMADAYVGLYRRLVAR
ncbi:glycosyl transferase family 1 [Caballeronia mineralivorans PML1(12)]|uniref:Glycosyl transferase family 1 n=1 Tax=Caballeronia mineralivorans PML1(12) TaxID=908627 RepID=A0A0J1G672_9BURK|nr:glycosyltransferase family 4 protein [Caballeronia mineralivorans]KLU27753.1 glycosyl transferase family 1 [Caballeronia mineralivorans PML1(12)]